MQLPHAHPVFYFNLCSSWVKQLGDFFPHRNGNSLKSSVTDITVITLDTDIMMDDSSGRTFKWSVHVIPVIQNIMKQIRSDLGVFRNTLLNQIRKSGHFLCSWTLQLTRQNMVVLFNGVMALLELFGDMFLFLVVAHW